MKPSDLLNNSLLWFEESEGDSLFNGLMWLFEANRAVKVRVTIRTGVDSVLRCLLQVECMRLPRMHRIVGLPMTLNTSPRT